MNPTIIAGLLMWIVSVTGWAPITPPPVKMLGPQEQIEWGGLFRGYYENQAVYLMELDEPTLVHELTHCFQTAQGRLTEIPYGSRKLTVEDCDERFELEKEAYKVENIYRRENQLLPEADLMIAFAVHMQCVERASRMMYRLFEGRYHD